MGLFLFVWGLKYTFIGQFLSHFFVCAVYDAKSTVGRRQHMLGGKVYVGFLFAHQFHRLAVFVFIQLIDTVTLRTKPKVIGNHCAFTVIEIFVGVKQSVCLPLLEKQSFGICGVVCRCILRRAFAVFIGITAVKVCIMCAVNASSDNFFGILYVFTYLCGNFVMVFSSKLYSYFAYSAIAFLSVRYSSTLCIE